MCQDSLHVMKYRGMPKSRFQNDLDSSCKTNHAFAGLYFSCYHLKQGAGALTHKKYTRYKSTMRAVRMYQVCMYTILSLVALSVSPKAIDIILPPIVPAAATAQPAQERDRERKNNQNTTIIKHHHLQAHVLGFKLEVFRSSAVFMILASGVQPTARCSSGVFRSSIIFRLQLPKDFSSMYVWEQRHGGYHFLPGERRGRGLR